MLPANTYREKTRRVIYFFPLQLLILHIKKNHLLLLFWLILFGIITKSFAGKYGIPYLFLNPEYLGTVGFRSYFIMGISIGGFIMTYNIASYVTNGSRFPFIATLSRPFMKYSINNSFFPLAFILSYIYFIVSFQLNNEIQSKAEILSDCLGIVSGILLFLVLSYVYFFSTNKNIFQLVGLSAVPKDKQERIKAILDLSKSSITGDKLRSFIAPLRSVREWKVKTYLSSPFKIRLAREAMHYDKEMLMRVFNQNHINATRFQILIFITLLVLGFFRDVSFFEIPAGASLVLIFTMFLTITSVLHTWLRGWLTTALIILFLLLNYLSQFELFTYRNKAYGMNYRSQKASYSNDALREHAYNLDNCIKDVSYTKKILNKWKDKNSNASKSDGQKPKLVLISASGGGLKSALWTFHVLQHTDSILNGELLKHTQLITGSSGGLIGAGYLRELYLRHVQGKLDDYYDASYLDCISKDILNPVSFSLAINDLFLRWQKFEDSDNSYLKDRGYAFEKRLNKNTNYIFDKRLADYTQAEYEAIVPMIIFSPTIINDGRRLLISSQPISYLIQNLPSGNITNNQLVEEIEFSRFFRMQNAGNVKFTSVLRMNATFPYIMPMVSLPSDPVIEVMDAGARDNYGLQTTVRFIYTFRNWISLNTGGVLIIQIRERTKQFPIEDTPHRTLLQTSSAPIGNFYDNLFKIQDYNNDQLLQYASSWFDGKIDVIDFQLSNKEGESISLSWHLTPKEKRQILGAIELPENQEAIQKLQKLLLW